MIHTLIDVLGRVCVLRRLLTALTLLRSPREGSNYTLHASNSQISKGKGKRSAALMGGGGAGGGKGAAIGALVGAGAAAAGAGLTGKGEIELGAESRISTRLRRPLELKQ